jgi:hypothetical protein
MAGEKGRLHRLRFPVSEEAFGLPGMSSAGMKRREEISLC